MESFISTLLLLTGEDGHLKLESEWNGGALEKEILFSFTLFIIFKGFYLLE
jgi:hypothetical protein